MPQKMMPRIGLAKSRAAARIASARTPQIGDIASGVAEARCAFSALVTLRPFAQEIGMDEILRDHDMHHGVEKRHVRPRL